MTMATELDELRSQVRVLADREEIRHLIADYRFTLDRRDMRAFSELFAREGTWSGRSGEATGPEGIYTMLIAQLPDNPPAPASTLYHLNSDPVIDVAGDRATAFTHWMHVRRGENDTVLMPTLGAYEDTLVREDGRWRFERRTVIPLIPA
jgi:hypothetical protein